MKCRKHDKDPMGAPELVMLYIRNRPSRMNKKVQAKFTPVGWMCPKCLSVDIFKEVSRV